ncbi:protein-disulfide reductase DsbD family protein [Flavobacterium soyangense]|uniref:Thioredoxin family protein n=1 Tax=Flavobacterium soyangense TaxID=2023265 RepID=A0A930XWR8_9FLAO|nr:cytochrome c biogenesis protein CcdA [Flavobacterium soyangense]MBF2709472.1 thioredoxin family protein [Flavobacterium soyangense]
MKKIIFLLLAFLALAKGNSQILDPVKWTTKIEKKSENNYVLTFNGVIENDWHMYSQFTPDGGPLPLEVIFKNQKGNFNLVGKAKEGKTTTAYNDVFGVNETFFVKNAQIQQEITLTNPKISKIDVALNYQVCKDACINLEKKFSFVIPSVSKTETETIKIDTSKIITTTSKPEEIKETVTAVSKAQNAHSKPEKQKGLWSIFFIAFFSGFAALLTPCVFPMIPMTVSFFTKQSKTRATGIANAIFYGLSIIFIYVALGMTITGIFGADALNVLSTGVLFNIIFFVVLVVFAFSFLGAFEIMLPNSWANKLDKQAGKTGIIAIFFMALVLAIVSFSCTGPIVGTLLVQAASQGGIAPIIGMLGFSSAIAIPFMLFAIFPTWLHSLPKSGGWMNSVKVSLGFLELALAFKFLSNADLVLQLHLLEREVFLAIWIAIFGTFSLYLLGKISMPHDSPLEHISVGRLSLGLVVLSFTIYMIPGLWGAPLKLINAFPPPMEYSESPLGFSGSGNNTSTAILPDGAKLGPHQIVVFNDYDKGLAYAKTVNKPIMLDFTGYACVNCRKMENNVWSDARVLSILKNDVVLISLYVDDKRDLPKNEQFISKTTGSDIETIGDKWADYMISKYKTNTQPLYVLTDLNGNSLNQITPTISYTGVDEYESWLKTGISKFKK